MNDFSKHQTIVVVTAEWDEEASVWVATSEDEKIGLVTEAPTLDELKDRVLTVLPNLIQDNLSDEKGLEIKRMRVSVNC
ncbi:DUF1902 domain-containing protein [Labrenzia sp. DG1229]|uniref:DUF1902 domain-containing protein n=1 Tax=Labrenzia sp. DG1229 TaxID=681847 RepID=UPI00068F3F98|nr:DUF1902 domain-containing protein [Labrenzia sp. DG1229]